MPTTKKPKVLGGQSRPDFPNGVLVDPDTGEPLASTTPSIFGGSAARSAASTPVSSQASAGASPAPSTPQEKAGTAFIQAREKAKAQGFNDIEANAIAESQVQGQNFELRSQEEVLANRAALQEQANLVGQVPGETQQAGIQTGQTQPQSQPDANPISIGAQSVLNQAEKTQLIAGLSVQTPILAKIMAGVAGLTFGAGTASAGIAGKVISNAKGVKALVAGAVLGKVTTNARQKVSEANKIFTSSKANMNRITNALNSGQISPSEAVSMFNAELQNINDAERALKQLTSGLGGINAFISGGGDELAGIIAYRRGELPLQQSALRQAILNPNPEKVSFLEEDFLQ